MATRKTSGPDQGHQLFAFFNEIGIISSLAGAMFERRLPDGLSSAQFGVLNWFHRVDDSATPTRLAVAFQVTGGAMTNTLKRLEAKKLVKIEPHPDSGRQKLVTITAAGRRMRERAIAAARPLLADFAAEFDLDKIEQQMQELIRVREYLDEYRYRNPPE